MTWGYGMDARLWSGLQNYIDLSMVYAKLPIDAFFRLRAVCKKWNRLASDPSFLQESFKDPLPTPYFLVDGPMNRYRLLTFDSSSRRWSWTHFLPRAECAMAGLLCTTSYRVFNIHTRAYHTLPSLPPVDDEALVEGFDEPLVGMTVDTSVNPPSFRVILGHNEIGTRIYDSKSGSWLTDTPSVNEFWAMGQDSMYGHSDPTCVECDGGLWIRVWGMYRETVDLHTYELENDVWDRFFDIPGEGALATFGVWLDRLFVFGMQIRPARAIVAWYRNSQSEGTTWTVFDRMPEDLCAWMLAGQVDDGPGSEEMEMRTKFCGESVLVYNCVGEKDVAEKAVLYNLDSKAWEKVEVPGDDNRDRTGE